MSIQTSNSIFLSAPTRCDFVATIRHDPVLNNFMPKTFKSLLHEENAADLLDLESMLTIFKYIKPREYASLLQDYNQFVKSVGDSYTFGNYLLDVVVSDRKFEERELAALGGVKYISELQYNRSSESISFDTTDISFDDI